MYHKRRDTEDQGEPIQGLGLEVGQGLVTEDPDIKCLIGHHSGTDPDQGQAWGTEDPAQDQGQDIHPDFQGTTKVLCTKPNHHHTEEVEADQEEDLFT